MSILGIYDDCLIRIFRMLSPLDLLSLHDTCTRFSYIAAEAFPIAHKEINLNVWCPGADYDTMINVDRMTKLLMAFGDSIAGLKLKFRQSEDELIRKTINIILTYCSGTLKSFDFSTCRGNRYKVSVSKLRPLLVSLKSLSLGGCVWDDDSLFSDCHNLVNLRILNDYYGYKRFNKLFDSLHPRLECLQLGQRILDVLSVKDFERITRKHTKLRMLSLSCSNNSYSVQSESLKSLKLSHWNDDQTVVPTARALFGQLEALSLKRCRLSGDDLFSECERLQKLTYYLEESFIKTSKSDFPYLKTFKLLNAFRDENNDICLSEKLSFLKHHRGLKELTIWDDEGGMISEFIADKMNSLTKIRIKSKVKCTKTCISLSKMEHIKKLILHCRSDSWNEEKKDENYSSFLSGWVSIESIEYLDMTNVFVNNLVIEAIGKFKKLRELKLDFEKCSKCFVILRLEPLESLSQLTVLKMEGPWHIPDSDLVSLVKKLEKLRSLSLNLMYFAHMDKVYDGITEIVHNRKQLLALSFKSEQKKWGSYTNTSSVRIIRDARHIFSKCKSCRF